MFSGSFSQSRLRRMRQTDWSRRLMAETTLNPADLIWPAFLLDGQGLELAVDSLPGVSRYSIDRLIEKAKEARDFGIPMLALFPCVDASLKSEDGREAYNPDSLAYRAIQAIKAEVPEIGLMCDVALDLYTTHGHDGLYHQGEILNDETVEVLVKQALSYADAGIDCVGPSDMMDGRVGAIRQALERNGHPNVQIFSYAAKYSSGLYGPYRDAVGSSSQLGASPKHSYQQDPANRAEALREAEQDIAEGADALIVKPGTYYLDIIREIKREFQFPTIAYHVSGEYAMLKAAGERGWLDSDRVMREAILSLKRAGSDAIITYAALDLAMELA